MPDEPANNEPQPEVNNDNIQDINSVNSFQQNPETTIPSAPVETIASPTVVDSAVNQIAPQTVLVKPSFFKRKKVIIGLIIAVAIIIIGSVSTFAMTSWYQNPDKVLADSIINAATTRASIYTGDFNYEGGGVKVKVGITGKQADLVTGSLDVNVSVDYAGKNYSVDTSALQDSKGDLYIKLSNLKSIVAEAKTALGIPDNSPISVSVDKLVSKIDGTWVKISSEDLAKYSESVSKSKTCMDDALTKLSNNNAAVTQIADIYRNNAFVIIDKDLGLKDGKFSYEVKLSIPIAKSFVAKLKETETYKSLVACDSSIAIDENSIKDDFIDSSSNPNDEVVLTVWVDYWSHQMAKIEAKGDMGESTFLATIVPTFNQKVTIDTPQNSITLTQLQSYIEEIYTSLYSSYSY